MQEHPSPSSKDSPAASLASQPPDQKQRVDTFSVYEILKQTGEALRRADPTLDVELPVPLPKLPQLLTAIQPTVLSSDLASSLDVWVPHKLSVKARAGLRKMAQDLRPLMFQDTNTNPPQTTLPIHTSRTLTSADFPARLTQEQRDKVKARFQDILASDENAPDPHIFLPVSILEQSLPSVKGNVLITAVDDDDNMPTKKIMTIDCLWNTGSQITIISDDILGADFLNFLHFDSINEPYRHVVERMGGVVTKVQVSAMVEMSNGVIQLDTIALVVPRQAIPSQRSGVIIGQRGTIDCIQYTSVPRHVMKAEGRDPGESYWGVFEVDKYMDAYDALIHV